MEENYRLIEWVNYGNYLVGLVGGLCFDLVRKGVGHVECLGLKKFQEN